jgi:hypothetical protein
MELYDRIMVGVRTERLELDEAWSFLGKKQKNVLRYEITLRAIRTFLSLWPARKRPSLAGVSASVAPPHVR